ncbi:MAG: hypothetical protein OJF49_002306 [Ktedonobacterales bacterium]|jgi:hypothetical protein|nr:MAG: hypothetical protein OJF49_002306 [Ktedonobacterales bacterium]
MMNPVLLDDHLHAHRNALLCEAATERLRRAATAQTLTPHDALASRLGDLLLLWGLKLKQRSYAAPVLTTAGLAPTSGVRGYRLAPAAPGLVPALSGVRPTFGLHLLQYDQMPTIGLMYWRANMNGGYLALTWLAEREKQRV